MELSELKLVVEALIFAADAPLTPERIRETLSEELNGFDLNQIIEDLNRDYAGSGRAFFIRQVAGGYQVTTRPELHTWIKKLFLGRNKMRLSQAALESLAIIAFKQPISRVDVAQIRGVNSDGVIGTLLEKKLVTISGRSEGVGRPLLYNTTPEFLQYFGVNDLADLPKPREIEELIGKEGMPEEVLQALSDEKQLELPIELSAETPAEMESSAPVFASLAPPEKSEEEASSSELADSAPAAEGPTSPHQSSAAEHGLAAPAENVETPESVEAEVDAILVEDPDTTESPDSGEEKAYSADEISQEEKSAAAEPGGNFFLEDAGMAVATDAAVFLESPATESERVEPALEEEASIAPLPPRERKKRMRPVKEQVQDETTASAEVMPPPFQPEVRVVDLEALTMPPVVPFEDDTTPVARPVGEFLTEQSLVDEPAVVHFEELAQTLPHVPVVQVVEVDSMAPLAIAEDEAQALSVSVADDGHEAEPGADAPRLRDDFTWESETIASAQMMQARPHFIREDEIVEAPRPATEWRQAEAPEFVQSPAMEKNSAGETPSFFVLAPSENGAQQGSLEKKSESGVLTFFKKAVGWIKSAWWKFVGK